MTSQKDTGDPNRCRLELHVADDTEARNLRSKIQPLLVGLDPSFFYINVFTPSSLQEERSDVIMDDIHRLAKMSQVLNSHQLGTGSHCSPPSGACDKLKTPSLAVMAFLKDTSVVSCAQAQNILKCPPWKFHHKIELSNARKGQLKVIGRQEFYHSGRQMPLWSVCPIHYGNLHLRFTIFTRNFASMVDFYRLLVGHEAEFTRDNFCLFTVHSRPGFDLQLAIKQSSQLHPAPLLSAFLNFRVPNFRQLESMIQTPSGLAGTLGQVGDGLWMILDPDLNCVLVEESNNSDHLCSPSNMVSTDAHNGNTRRNVRDTDPFRRSRMLRDHLQLVKEYKSDHQRSNPQTKQSYRGYGLGVRAANSVPCPRPSRPLPDRQFVGEYYNSAPWSDQSSYDSGRHSWRSGQETGGSSSEQSGQSDDAETSSPAATCDCHVIRAGRCARCLGGKSRSVLAPLPKSSSQNIGQKQLPSAGRGNRKTKPWEIEPPELSEVEWDGLLSLADSDDVNFR